MINVIKRDANEKITPNIYAQNDTLNPLNGGAVWEARKSRWGFICASPLSSLPLLFVLPPKRSSFFLFDRVFGEILGFSGALISL